MARSKKRRDDEDVVTVKDCRHREGDWRCIRQAIFDVDRRGNLMFVQHVGEPLDPYDLLTGRRKPAHYMVNTATPRQRIIIGEP